MADTSIKVAIYGATGETGGLIVNGLLKSEDAQFVRLYPSFGKTRWSYRILLTQ